MPYWKHPPKPIVALISIDEARYTVLIYETLKGFEDGYRAEVPVLPGCSAEAKTQKEVLDRIVKAIRTHREADRPQASAPPDPPPGWKGPIFAWAMVLYLLEEMNEQEEQYKEIEALRTTHPEEAAARSSSLYQHGFSGTSAQMRHVADTLFSQGSDAALEAYGTWLLQEFPFTNPERGRKLAAASDWPAQVKAMLERIGPVHTSLAAWTLLSDPILASRLRQCRVCERYFLDRSRNRTQQCCSAACRNRAWTRPARRAAARKRMKAFPPSGFQDLILPPFEPSKPAHKRKK